MRAALRQPKWIVATIVVGLLAALFVYLGFWQLDRRDSRLANNREAAERLAMPAIPLQELLDSTSDTSSLEFRRVTVEGSWSRQEEVLIRSQVHLGTAGFHVVTPLVHDAGAILVNRGWVPLVFDTTPVELAPPPPPGQLTGWIELTEERGFLGPEERPGVLTVFNRVDIERIQQQVDEPLAPVYMVLIVDDEGELPAPVGPPDFDDEGPHLAYAIQWFGFAAIGVIGFYFLVRRKAA